MQDPEALLRRVAEPLIDDPTDDQKIAVPEADSLAAFEKQLRAGVLTVLPAETGFYGWQPRSGTNLTTPQPIHAFGRKQKEQNCLTPQILAGLAVTPLHNFSV